jgi:hypothetical protein
MTKPSVSVLVSPSFFAAPLFAKRTLVFVGMDLPAIESF